MLFYGEDMPPARSRVINANEHAMRIVGESMHHDCGHHHEYTVLDRLNLKDGEFILAKKSRGMSANIYTQLQRGQRLVGTLFAARQNLALSFHLHSSFVFGVSCKSR